MLHVCCAVQKKQETIKPKHAFTGGCFKLHACIPKSAALNGKRGSATAAGVK